MKDWVQLITALIQSITALIILKQNCRKKKKVLIDAGSVNVSTLGGRPA
ncbi:hypothetical protein [Paenibacillus alvei]|nr:hypothetical protein [Paenibacillus alvei]